MKQINVTEIESFRAAAMLAGNQELVARCDRAIAGDQDAWWLIRAAIHAESVSVIGWLAARGVTIGRADVGSIRLPSGEVAFVSERTNRKGQTVTTIMHPANPNRAEPAYQRFTSRERALRAIQGGK